MRGCVVPALAALLALLAGAAAAQDASPPAAPAQATPAAPPPAAWLPRQSADLEALDKVSAQATKLALDVGQSTTFGTLTIAVRACDVRPPDQPADATAWLDITDSTPGAPQFHGWMIASAPAVSGLEHPTYDVRLTGCH